MSASEFTNVVLKMKTIKTKHVKMLCLCILIQISYVAGQSVINDVSISSDSFTFFGEIQNLGNEYFQSQNKTKFIPLIGSLLNRIKEYAKNRHGSNYEKKLLRYLYTAGLSELFAMRSHYTIISCTNIVGYMDLCQDEIRNVQHKPIILLGDMYYNSDYESNMVSKIEDVNDFIKIDMMPKVTNVSTEIENEIVKFIDEKNDEELKKSLILLQLSKLMSTTSPALELLGQVSHAVTSMMNDATLIAETFLDEKVELSEEMSTFEYKLRKSLSTLRSKLNNTKTLFLKQIEDIERRIVGYLEDHSSDELSVVKQKIESIICELSESNVIIEYDLVNIKRNELKELIVKKIESLQHKNQSENSNISEQIRILKYAKKLFDLSIITSNIYDIVRDDDMKMETLSKTIETINDELMVWKETEKNVYSLMLNHLCEIENTRNEVFKAVANYKHIEFNISQWHIPNLITELKLTLHRKLDVFSENYGIQQCYDRLNAGMDSIIDVYNRIDTYLIIATFKAYFELSVGNMPADGTNVQISTLTQIIRTNIALQQYERAIFIYNQHQFPFHDTLISKLPTDFQSNDTETFINHSIKHIDYLKERVDQSRKSQGEYDNDLHKMVRFNNNSNEGPFYTFKYDKIKMEIDDLLQGNAIIVTPNIKNLTRNAFKFDRIGIRLKLENENEQSELDDKLELFMLRMSAMGNFYFKCGQRFYSTTFQYLSIAYNPDGKQKPRSANQVYAKIMKGDLFLSPFTTWKIKLADSHAQDYTVLESFRNKTIDLELIGRGQYFDDQASVASQICTEDLDKHYTIDRGLSNVV